MASPAHSRRRLYAWILAGAAMLAVTIVVRWRFWTHFRTGDGALAPAYLGPHVLAGCANCGFEVALGVASDPALRKRLGPHEIQCPNCSAVCPVPPQDEAEDGDRIFLRHLARPERWDVVAYRPAADPEEIALSRVVGLPGESFELRDGDVFVGGSRPARRPGEAAELWQLVHADAFTPRTPQRGGPAWVPDEGSPWRWTDGRWTIEKPVDAPARLAFRGSITSRVPYASLYGGPGSDPRRDAPATDVRLTVRLGRFSGEGRLRLLWRRGDLEVAAAVEASGEASLVAGGAGTRGRLVPLATAPSLRLAILDGRAYLGTSEPPALELELPEREDLQGMACLLAVEASGCAVEIARLRIERDVHYVPGPIGAPAPASPARAGPVALGPDQYYLLGDNSPHSLDSRWYGPVAAESILGVVHNLSR